MPFAVQSLMAATLNQDAFNQVRRQRGTFSGRRETAVDHQRHPPLVLYVAPVCGVDIDFALPLGWRLVTGGYAEAKIVIPEVVLAVRRRIADKDRRVTLYLLKSFEIFLYELVWKKFLLAKSVV